MCLFYKVARDLKPDHVCHIKEPHMTHTVKVFSQLFLTCNIMKRKCVRVSNFMLQPVLRLCEIFFLDHKDGNSVVKL